jgi:DNA polymerase-4
MTSRSSRAADPSLVAVSSRRDLELLAIGLLQNEMPLPKPVRLLGVSLLSLKSEGDDDAEAQLGLPI